MTRGNKLRAVRRIPIRQIQKASAISLALLLTLNFSQAAADNVESDQVCSLEDVSSSKKSKETNEGSRQRVLVGATCVGLSGHVETTGQMAKFTLPGIGALTAPRVFTFNGGLRVETARPTIYGTIKTAIEVDWSATSSTGPDKAPNLDEATIAFRGFTIGYGDSLMNFWDGDFQFKAYSPNLTTYLMSKEFSVLQDTTLAFAVEAGPPDSRGAASWEFPTSPPYYSSRLRYEKDDWSFHLSAAAHEIAVSRTPLLVGSEDSRVGFAASLGSTIPLPILAEDDSLSLQLTYAADARVFLGTATDRSVLASILPQTLPLPTEGWSGVVSLQHNWTDKLASNVMVSRVVADLNAAGASGSIQVERTAANLIYQVNDRLKFGAEVGYVKAKIEVDGTLGLINQPSFAGATIFLGSKIDF